MSEKKTYVTTARAGFIVAGQRIPSVPKVGHELQLTDAEAEYELRQGTIALKEQAAGAAAGESGAASDGAAETDAASTKSKSAKKQPAAAGDAA